MTADLMHTLHLVKTFVSTKLGIEEHLLTEHFRIEEDAGIAGLDTYSFYEDFFEEFNIGNPEGFQVSKYVTSENLEFKKFVKSLFSKRVREENSVKTVTLLHLARVACAKKWFDAANAHPST